MKSFDLNLPSFGPYSKKFAGISHIFQEDNPWRYDMTVFTGRFRRYENLPNCRFDSNYHPWESSAEADFYSYRIENLWKDQLYSDISFMKVNNNSRLIKVHCVNNTNEVQDISLHYISSLEAFHNSKNSEPLSLKKYLISENTQLKSSLDYDNLTKSIPNYDDNLYYDGRRYGETYSDAYYQSYGLKFENTIPYYLKFAKSGPVKVQKNIDAQVQYTFKKIKDISNYTLYLKFNKNVNASYFSENISIVKVNSFLKQEIDIAKYKSDEDIYLKFELSEHSKPIRLELDIKNASNLIFDYLVLCPNDAENIQNSACIVPKVPSNILQVKEIKEPYRCEINHEFESNTIEFFYPEFNLKYRLKILESAYDIKCRTIKNDDLDPFLHEYIHEHVQSTLVGNNKGEYSDVFVAPIRLDPKSDKVIYAYLESIDTSSEFENESKNTNPNYLTSAQIKNIEEEFKSQAALFSSRINNPYQFSIERIKATIACNTVYPVRINNHYVKHSTPGKWWDSVYTWDAGFIGLGLSTINLGRSIDTLKMYLGYGLEDDQAFLHHGSLIPTQFYQLEDIFNRLSSYDEKVDLVRELYPRLKRALSFYLGEGSSSLKNESTNLLRPWDYFYNSGGWDDYPPQKEIHNLGLQTSAIPMITNSHAVRFCKIMSSFARILNCRDDLDFFNGKVSELEKSIQEYSWDDEEGIFSYLIDENSKGSSNGTSNENSNESSLASVAPNINKLKFNSVNFNHGLDGLSPLFAGICSDEQAKILWQRILDKGHYWTNIGISSVDISAPYYLKYGYWNGAVWFPYQYLFFKTMLDFAMADEAYSLAHNLLNLWKKEVENTYNCYEHFLIESELGTGWHQFSGLSSPIMNFYETYYKDLCITSGFDISILSKRVELGNYLKEFEFIANRSGNKVIIISSKNDLNFTECNFIKNIRQREKGLYEINVEVERNQKYKIILK